MDHTGTLTNRGVNWKQVGWFLGLTFGFSWLIDLVLWLTADYGQNAAAGMLLQLQMLVPAFCAIVLGMFVFKNNPLYDLRVNRGRPRIFFYYYIVFTLIYVALGVVSLVTTDTTALMAVAGAAQGLTLLGLIILIVLRFVSGREAYARAGLAGGKCVYWVLFGLGFALLYLVQTGLNYLLDLGQAVDVMEYIAAVAPEQAAQVQMSPAVLFWVTALQSVLLAPFMALLFGFGEEFGWRGYLQSELIKIGKIKGILLLGIIWGLWHAPVILMGHNYPGYPVAGVFLMTAYTVGLGFLLGYAVLKSGSVLLAAYLHALNNQVASFLMLMAYKPDDPVFSFGVGLYGIAFLAVVVLIVLRDPIWRESVPELPAEPTSPAAS